MWLCKSTPHIANNEEKLLTNDWEPHMNNLDTIYINASS